MTTPFFILCITDDPAEISVFEDRLRPAGYDPVSQIVQTCHDAASALLEREWDVLLVKAALPGCSIDQATQLLQDSSRELPMVVFAGLAAIDLTVSTLKTAARGREKYRQAMLAQQQFKDAFNSLLAGNPLPMWIYDRETYVFLEVNGAAIAKYGYLRDEFLAMRITDIRPPEDVPALLADLREDRPVIQSPAGWRHRLSNGQVIDVEITSHTLEFKGHQAVLVLAQDITQRKQRERELQAVANISAAMRAARTLDEMLRRLLDEGLTTLRGSAGSIWLYDAAADELRMSHSQGWGPSPPPVKRGQAVPGYVLATGQTYLSREMKTDPRTPEAIRPIIPAGRGAICAPIQAAEAVVGVVFINTELPREFTPAEARLLTTIAEIAGGAIHRMQLYEQIEQRLGQLNALRAIDLAITGSLDLRVTLGVVLEHVVAQLAVDAAAVLLLNSFSATLTYAAGRGFRTPGIQKTSLRLGEGYAGQAALERRVIRANDLQEANTQFLRSRLLAGEMFVSYVAAPLIAKGRVTGVLEIMHRTLLAPDARWVSFLGSLAGQAAIAVDNAQLFDSLQRSNADLRIAYEATIEGWSRALDLRDHETEGHSQRVTELTERLAIVIGVSQDQLETIRQGALLHDIGKMGIPDGVLLKPGSLTDDEWVIMRQHPQFAYEMLEPIAYLRPALDIPYCHHEKWDGSGYPRGLKGEQIPLAARVFAVVDVWDALRSDRPYRLAWPAARVREHIREQAGSHFDPSVAEAFLNMRFD